MSEQNISYWHNFIDIFYNAVEESPNPTISQRLVDFIVALASLPDAINSSNKDKIMDIGGGQMAHVQPGGIMKFANRTFWKDLPDFAMELSERFQASSQAPMSHRARGKSPEKSALLWKNMNTYVILLGQSPEAQLHPPLAGRIKRGIWTLATALEHSSSIPYEANLGVPAAAQWLSLAGPEIEQLCEAATEHYPVGDLWVGTDNTDVVDMARLQFWRRRLDRLAQGPSLW
ncbi:uncharacterized protein RCC_06076 [Ramularia collo-cygni]|uniref:Uncharacterized protein n=1 Tax=Ramularia collo-cygni TaxID=112498 RepID=A0A2D3VEN5_9PEZI|nr:uncharacterized protein RCC_06076 [Ramularia collo-cygni]CZT20219.1 uncharacterized protein RCC_06076 [Ramularia collo-cygni]